MKDPSARIIIVSAMGQESIVKDAINNGAKHFIVKPIETHCFKDTILKVLRN